MSNPFMVLHSEPTDEKLRSMLVFQSHVSSITKANQQNIGKLDVETKKPADFLFRHAYFLVGQKSGLFWWLEDGAPYFWGCFENKWLGLPAANTRYRILDAIHKADTEAMRLNRTLDLFRAFHNMVLPIYYKGEEWPHSNIFNLLGYTNQMKYIWGSDAKKIATKRFKQATTFYQQPKIEHVVSVYVHGEICIVETKEPWGTPIHVNRGGKSFQETKWETNYYLLHKAACPHRMTNQGDVFKFYENHMAGKFMAKHRLAIPIWEDYAGEWIVPESKILGQEFVTSI